MDWDYNNPVAQYIRENFDPKIIINSGEDIYKSTGVLPIGYVYLIKSGDYYKIGVANDVLSRINELQIGNPIELGLMHALKVPDPYGVEKSLHNMYSTLRHRGEWFILNEEHVEWFRTELQKIVINSINEHRNNKT